MKYTQEEIEQYIDMFKGLMDEYNSANDRYSRNQWKEKYGERLEPYEGKLKTLNGDEFSILDESYDEYHDKYSDFESDKYIDALEGNIKKVIERIWPEAPEEVKQEAAEQISEAVDEGGEITGDEVETHTVEEKEEPGEDELESDSNAKTRYQKRSASNKAKLAGWDPQKRLGSDEDCKEPPEEDPVESFKKDLEADFSKYHK